MTNRNLVGTWVRRFLLEHLVGDLNLSRNTQASYRDALALLLPFAARNARQPVDQLEVERLTPEVIRGFLAHLEGERHCSVTTRNQRLAAIHHRNGQLKAYLDSQTWVPVPTVAPVTPVRDSTGRATLEARSEAKPFWKVASSMSFRAK